jgi:hypothetical protein
MFRTPHRDCEPAPLLFARLLRDAQPSMGELFGDDVGVELSDAPPPNLGIDGEAVSYADRCKPVLPSEMKAMLLDTLGPRRGVLTGLPAVAGLSAKPQERILPLGGKAVAGHAWWWLWWLRRTAFSRRDSYTYRTDEVVYRVGGDARQSFNWFPGGSTYGMEAGKLSAYIDFGVAAHVREITAAPREPTFDAQVQQAAIQLYTQLEAAAYGVAPAVFAAMLVTDSDDYGARSKARLDATAAAEGLALTSDASRVAAVVTVSQLHTFRMSDMLRAYASMGPEENRRLAKQAIKESLHEACNRMNDLAVLKILKLTMVSDSVVFCPELKETEDDEWEVLGYTFRAAGFDPVAGKPRLVDYDHRLCKRMTGAEGYDAKCAYLLMMTIFLSSVRAQFPAVYPMVYEAVQTFGHWKEAVAAAPDKIDAFRNMLQRCLVHPRVERDPLPKGVLEQTIDDFAAIVGKLASNAGSEICTSCDKRPAYHRLVLWLLGARSVLEHWRTVSEEDALAERDQHRKDMARVYAVMSARQMRLASRMKK